MKMNRLPCFYEARLRARGEGQEVQVTMTMAEPEPGVVTRAVWLTAAAHWRCPVEASARASGPDRMHDREGR